MMDLKAIVQLLVFVLAIFTTRQAWGEKDCYHEKDLVYMYCLESITVGGGYVRPKGSCCDPVRSYDMICICSKILPMEERLINAKKLVQVAKDCGKPILGGTQCGSFTVPRKPARAKGVSS
ncbi:unnamed protein product [Urochloa decumbens]|uniref:Bifunctional inhibitor/plant lipid transfer protein/seed storage helical domain-containing protein n=1 Tax=Urochloa decumbens TaxID=240449 RepID=A0ABC9H3E7_9POAL